MRWRRLLLGLGAVVLVGVAGLWLTSRANYNRIDRGMTLAEVEVILGSPGMHINRGPEHPKAGDYVFCSLWSGQEMDVWVFFDSHYRVVRSECYGRDSWVDRLRHLLPW
jgi:hypothetical protein